MNTASMRIVSQRTGGQRAIAGWSAALILAILAGPWFAAAVHAQAANEEADAAAVRDFNATAALQNSGFYARAAEKWTAFLQKYPTDSRLDKVNYYLGICQLHTKNFPEAIKTFQGVLTKYPQFAAADGVRFNLAMAQYQIAVGSQKPDDYKAAAAAFQTMLEKHAASPQAAKANYYWGESLYAAGDRPGAIAAYKKLIASGDKSSLLMDAHYALATAQQESAADADAVQTLTAFFALPGAEQHELAGEMRLRLGTSQFALKKFDEAEKAFATVAAVPNFPLADFALLRQGECRLELAKPAEAIAVFADLAKRFPTSAYAGAASLAAGKAQLQTNQLADAEKTLTPLAASKDKAAAEASYWLGRTLLKANQPQKALALLDTATKTFPTGDFAAYLQMARIDALYELPERRKETAALYAAFAQQHPQHPLALQALYMAALASLGAEDFPAARKNAEAFLQRPEAATSELQPAVTFIAAEAYLLPQQAVEADLAKAEQLYRDLLTKHPNHPRAARAQLRIGWRLLQAKKYDEAIKHLQDNLAKLTEPAMKAEASQMIGQSHEGATRFAEAIAAYQTALQAVPNGPRGDEILLALAHCHRQLKQADPAATRLKELLAGYKDSPLRAAATYELAELAQAAEKYDEAIAGFKQVVEQFATSEFAAPAQYGLAAAAFAKGDYPATLPPLTQILATPPANPAATKLAAQATYLRGMANQRLKQFEPAAKDLQAFLAANPNADEATDARFALALCEAGRKQHEAAANRLKTLLDEKPEYRYADRVAYELGHALAANGKPTEAAAAFRRLTETQPNSPLLAEAFFWIGRHHEDAGDAATEPAAKTAEFAKAAAAFQAGLAKTQDAELLEKMQYKLGDMQFRQQQYPAAGKTLLEQLTKFPQGSLAGPAKFLAGECLFRQDNFAEALPQFEAVIAAKVEPYLAQASYRAGACAASLKRWPDSQKHYETLLAQFPKFEQAAEAKYGLAWALQNQAKLDQAKPLYQQVTAQTQTETAAKAQFMLGEIEFANKKYEDAIEQYLLAAVGYPFKNWQALARFEIARCFVELKKNDKAIEMLQTLIDQHPDHPKAKDAATLMMQLKK